MRLTLKQRTELAVLKWFADSPSSISDENIREYFQWSDQGKHKDKAQAVLMGRALGRQDISDGFKTLVAAKMSRDLQVKMWKEDWGTEGMPITSWDFIHEPQEVVEWVAKTLDRESIISEWHKERAREHRRAAYKYDKTMQAKPFNRSMQVSRS